MKKKNTDLGVLPELTKKPLRLRIRPWLILLPTILVTIGIFYPFISSIVYSFTGYSFKKPVANFVGLRNWISMFKDKNFWTALGVTLEFAISATVIEMVFGLLIAMTLNKDRWYTKPLKVILIFPLMVAPVIACLVWQLMLNSSIGIVEKLLNIFGVYGFPWTASSKTAMMTVVMIDAWVYIPFVMLLMLAGLQSMPKSPFEAAQIDGGSAWFNFRTLTFPMLKPVFIIALVFRFMGSLQEFSVLYSMTKGGPGNTLTNLSILAYRMVFQYLKLGEAMPYLLILWIMIYIIADRLIKLYLKAKNETSGM